MLSVGVCSQSGRVALRLGRCRRQVAGAAPVQVGARGHHRRAQRRRRHQFRGGGKETRIGCWRERRQEGRVVGRHPLGAAGTFRRPAQRHCLGVIERQPGARILVPLIHASILGKAVPLEHGRRALLRRRDTGFELQRRGFAHFDEGHGRLGEPKLRRRGRAARPPPVDCPSCCVLRPRRRFALEVAVGRGAAGQVAVGEDVFDLHLRAQLGGSVDAVGGLWLGPRPLRTASRRGGGGHGAGRCAIFARRGPGKRHLRVAMELLGPHRRRLRLAATSGQAADLLARPVLHRRRIRFVFRCQRLPTPRPRPDGHLPGSRSWCWRWRRPAPR
mmetsp:Transcript_1364/g.4122  ORF Transcript_1364/g.4122 Transcript_1364/m.4122 type:complete len:330 (-) Transcript_1364:43-1032(-)